MKNKALIWTMGKVGSTTISKTLLASEQFCKKHEVYHVHWLNNKNITRVSSSHSSKGLELPEHLEVSKELLTEIDFNNPKDLIVITSLREILPTYISGFFQNIRRYIHNNPEIVNSDGSLDIKKVVTIIINNIYKMSNTAHYPEFWINTDFEEVLGIDLYSTPFNYADKYLIIEHQGIKILILRLEDLSSTLLNGLADLFESKYEFNIVNSNITKDKEYQNDYQTVSDIIFQNTELQNMITKTKYMQHFYKNKSYHSIEK